MSRWRHLLLPALLLLPLPAHAFATWQGGGARMLLRGFALADRNPASPLYPKRNEQGLGGLARLITEGHEGAHLAWQFNAYQTSLPAFMTGYTTATAGVERSGIAEWQFGRSGRDSRYNHLAIDRFNLRWTEGNVDVIAGRQAINLATTFYFVPNDLFAPFAAQTFYRTFKPGVDALRTEVRLGALSQLSLIATAGYSRDATRAGGWRNAPDAKRTGMVARYSTVIRGIEWAWLAGRVRRSNLVGGSIQGELFDWLGLRMEGHVRRDTGGHRRIEFAGGIEHRFASSLDLRAEYYYHGAGAPNVAGYTTVGPSSTGGSYAGRRYLALGGGYEFTPLLKGDAVAIRNIDDGSWLLSMNTVYSLADEAELVLNGVLPVGRRPRGTVLKSEFGSYPAMLLAEVRAYF